MLQKEIHPFQPLPPPDRQLPLLDDHPVKKEPLPDIVSPLVSISELHVQNAAVAGNIDRASIRIAHYGPDGSIVRTMQGNENIAHNLQLVFAGFDQYVTQGISLDDIQEKGLDVFAGEVAAMLGWEETKPTERTRGSLSAEDETSYHDALHEQPFAASDMTDRLHQALQGDTNAQAAVALNVRTGYVSPTEGQILKKLVLQDRKNIGEGIAAGAIDALSILNIRPGLLGTPSETRSGKEKIAHLRALAAVQRRLDETALGIALLASPDPLAQTAMYQKLHAMFSSVLEQRHYTDMLRFLEKAKAATNVQEIVSRFTEAAALRFTGKLVRTYFSYKETAGTLDQRQDALAVIDALMQGERSALTDRHALLMAQLEEIQAHAPTEEQVQQITTRLQAAETIKQLSLTRLAEIQADPELAAKWEAYWTLITKGEHTGGYDVVQFAQEGTQIDLFPGYNLRETKPHSLLSEDELLDTFRYREISILAIGQKTTLATTSSHFDPDIRNVTITDCQYPSWENDAKRRSQIDQILSLVRQHVSPDWINVQSYAGDREEYPKLFKDSLPIISITKQGNLLERPRPPRNQINIPQHYGWQPPEFMAEQVWAGIQEMKQREEAYAKKNPESWHEHLMAGKQDTVRGYKISKPPSRSEPSNHAIDRLITPHDLLVLLNGKQLAASFCGSRETAFSLDGIGPIRIIYDPVITKTNFSHLFHETPVPDALEHTLNAFRHTTQISETWNMFHTYPLNVLVYKIVDTTGNSWYLESAIYLNEERHYEREKDTTQHVRESLTPLRSITNANISTVFNLATYKRTQGIPADQMIAIQFGNDQFARGKSPDMLLDAVIDGLQKQSFR